MNHIRKALVGIVALVAAGQGTAFAQEGGIISELRAGIVDHDMYRGFIPSDFNNWYLNGIEDLSFEVLFTTPDLDVFRWIGSPRPHLGTTLNFDGRESMVHLGLTWQLPIFDTPFYLEGTFGAALHNGALNNPPPRMYAQGCRVNFYENAGVGGRFGEHLTATIYYEHMSNAGICAENGGLSNFGLKVGWRF